MRTRTSEKRPNQSIAYRKVISLSDVSLLRLSRRSKASLSHRWLVRLYVQPDEFGVRVPIALDCSAGDESYRPVHAGHVRKRLIEHAHTFSPVVASGGVCFIAQTPRWCVERRLLSWQPTVIPMRRSLRYAR
jgi:hypothetical protein